MKVGVLISSVSRKAGGAFEAVRGLALSLQQPPELFIEVFSLGDEFTSKDIGGWNPLPVHAFRIRGPKGFGYAPELRPALCASGLDLLHAHGSWMYQSMASLGWARHLKKPYLIAPHGCLDPWAVRNSRIKKHLAAWLYENQHLRGAACLHALCVSEAQAMRAYGLKNPICVIPNGIDLPQGSRSYPPPWQDVLPDGAKVMLYLGRLHPKKGLRNLLLAWNQIHKRKAEGVDDWHLVIAGWDEGTHEEELKVLSRRLGLQDSIHFIGPRFGVDKHATFYNAEAFILPSFSEGLPMGVLEERTYGFPVLMKPHCNLPEGFESGAALEVEVDSQSILEGITSLFAMTDAERVQMGMRGRKLAKQKFTWPRIAAEMRAVYEWTLGGGQPPPYVMMS